MASPRSKATKVQYALSKHELIVQFVKSNIKLLLNLVSEDNQNPENISLAVNEINALRVLFSVVKSDGTLTKPNVPLSSYAPFYTASSSSSAAKVKLGVVADWVLSVLSPKEPPDVVDIHGLTKAVTIQDDDLQGRSVKVTSCEDSYIYINSSPAHVAISACVNCRIMVPGQIHE
jgi:hypothetical protein